MKLLRRLAYGFSGLKAGLLAVSLLFYFGLCLYSGATVPEFLRFYLCAAAFWLLPGFALARLLFLKGRLAAAMQFPAGLTLGTAQLALFFCFAGWVGFSPLLYLCPLLGAGAALCCVKHKKRGGRRRFAAPGPRFWLLGLLFAGLLLTFAFAGVAKAARPLAAGDVLISEDLLFNVGNANALASAFPPVDLRFAGVPLRYHWLGELVSAAISVAGGISNYNILAFYLQPLWLALLLGCLWSLGGSLFGEKSPLREGLPWLLMFSGCASLWKILPGGISSFGNLFISHVVTNINSMATALVFAACFFCFFATGAKDKSTGRWVCLGLMGLAFACLCLAKGPFAAILVCALAAGALVGLFTRKTGVFEGAAALLCVAVFLGAYVLLFRYGAESSMAFDVDGTLDKGWFANILARLAVEAPQLYPALLPFFMLAAGALCVPGLVLPYLCCLAADLRRFKQLGPLRLSLHACSFGGMLAYFLFNHPSMSQAYFLYASVFSTAILAAHGLARLAEPWKRKWRGRLLRAACLALGAVGAVTACLLYVNLNGSGLRALLANVGVLEKYPYEVVVAPEDELAALWLAENTPENAVFATNRIHTGSRLEGISNLYTAFSARQCYMEGYKYVETNAGLPAGALAHRLAVYDALFFGAAAPEEIADICRREGIDYVLFSSQLPGSDEGLAALELVFDSPRAKIYKVNR